MHLKISGLWKLLHCFARANNSLNDKKLISLNLPDDNDMSIA